MHVYTCVHIHVYACIYMYVYVSILPLPVKLSASTIEYGISPLTTYICIYILSLNVRSLPTHTQTAAVCCSVFNTLFCIVMRCIRFGRCPWDHQLALSSITFHQSWPIYVCAATTTWGLYIYALHREHAGFPIHVCIRVYVHIFMYIYLSPSMYKYIHI